MHAIYCWSSKLQGKVFHHPLAESLKPTNPSPVEIKPLWTVHYHILCFAGKFSFSPEKHLFNNSLVSRVLGRSLHVHGLCRLAVRRRENGRHVSAVAQHVAGHPLCLLKWATVGGDMLFPTSVLRASLCGAVGWQLLLACSICLLTGAWDLCSWGNKCGLSHRQKRKLFVCLTCIAVVPGSLLFKLVLWCVFSERLWHWMRDSDWPEFLVLKTGMQFHQEERDVRLANYVLSWELYSPYFPKLLVWFPVVFPFQCKL